MFDSGPPAGLSFAAANSPVVRVRMERISRTVAGDTLAAAGARPPGPAAIALLDRVRPELLDDIERTEYLLAWERNARWVEAQRARAVVAVAGPVPADRDDWPRELVKAALAGAGGSARADVDLARALGGRLAAAGAALAAGEISYSHARVLLTETTELDDATAAEVAAAVLAAPAAQRSPAEFRRGVRRAVIAADPVRAELAAERAAVARAVSRRVLPDAQAGLTLTGPAAEVAAIWTAADAFAAHPDAGDDRPLDARRFDALVGICRDALARPDVPAGRRGLPATVYLYADLATWAGLAEHPVEVEGYGVVPAGAVRDRFTAARWRAVVTDAAGAPTAVTDTSYTPSAATNRLLHVTDRRCGFPGCGAAVWFCDADHNLPYDHGGCTDARNCGLLCRRHHRLKTFTRWSWSRGEDDSIQWIDPTGHRWHRDAIRYPMPARPDCPEPVADPAGQDATAAGPEPASTGTTAAVGPEPATGHDRAVPDPYPDDPPF